jgi:hypothetical protein
MSSFDAKDEEALYPRGFWPELRPMVYPALLAQTRDLVEQCVSLAAIAILFLFSRGLDLLGVERELITILNGMGNWAAIGCFAMTLLGALSRAFRSFGRGLRNE